MFDTLYGNYRTRTFCDIFPSETDFVNFYNQSPLKPEVFKDDYVSKLYYLLYAQYGNSHIANRDENQFKFGVMSTIFMYGPTWAKRLEIQNILSKMDIEELRKGNRTVFNHSINPSEPIYSMNSANQVVNNGTETDIELPTINDQDSNITKHSKFTAYSNLLDILKTDVTKEFIDKFKRLFLIIVGVQEPLWYISEEDND